MNPRALIVDDERPARSKIKRLLSGHKAVEIVGEADNGLEAVAAIRELQPDLVFLDIQMPGMTGFEVIEEIGAEQMPAVIFTTAYDEYALRAFEVSAVDYLLKPFSEIRFKAAVERAIIRLQESGEEEKPIAALLKELKAEPCFLRRIVVKEKDRVVLVSVDDVLRFVAKGNYVELHTATTTHLVRETIKQLESCLDPDRFTRIHRSEIINIDAIVELQPWFHGDYVILLNNGSKTKMSRRYSDRLLK